jgi:hypothetical protein
MAPQAVWRTYLVASFAAVVVLSACTDTAEMDDAALGLDYFPLEVGAWRIYDVQETQYSFPNRVDSIRYQMRESVSGKYEDLSGDSAYYLLRETRPDVHSPWQVDVRFTARRDARTAVVTEDNLPVIRLVFPPVEGAQWDSNRWNDRDADFFEIKRPGQAYDSLANTVTVVQESNDDIIIETDLRHEIFAQYIGLVYKEDIHFVYCTESECLGQQQIETGRVIRMQLIEHGKHD